MRVLVADDDRMASAILAKTLARWNLAVTVVRQRRRGLARPRGHC